MDGICRYYAWWKYNTVSFQQDMQKIKQASEYNKIENTHRIQYRTNYWFVKRRSMEGQDMVRGLRETKPLEK